MADDAKVNGEFSEDRSLDISGYETADSDSRTSPLTEKLAALEQENRQLVHDKDVLEKKVSDLRQSAEESGRGKEELEREVDKSKSEVKILESVAARASELEGEVSRLQHDLISAASALDESNSELSKVNAALDVAKRSESEKGATLEAVVKERDLLVKKYEELEAKESKTREEINGKEKEIRSLKEKLEELKVTVLKSGEDKKEAAGLRGGLERKVKELEAKVVVLEGKLEEKESLINGFDEKAREVPGGAVGQKGEAERKGLVVAEWPLVAGSVVGAVGLVGIVCYLRYARRT